MLGDAADPAEAPSTLPASGGAPPPLAGAKKSLGDPPGGPSKFAKANEFSKHGFAPPVVARLSNLSVPNDRPLYLQLEIVGHFSNVWVPLNRRVGFRVAVQWGAMIAAPKRHIHDHRHGDDSEGGLYWPGDGPR
jgi:hypothetical protein